MVNFLHAKLFAATFLLAFCLSACVSQPIVDLKGVDNQKHQQDLQECQQYADQVDAASSGVGGTLIGAGLGAAMGAMVGAILGDPATGAGIGLTVGGFSGGQAGVSNGQDRKTNVVNSCLMQRGYKVLG